MSCCEDLGWNVKAADRCGEDGKEGKVVPNPGMVTTGCGLGG